MIQELELFDAADLANLRIVKAFQTTDDELYLKPNDAIKHQKHIDRINIIRTVFRENFDDYEANYPNCDLDWSSIYKLIDILSDLSDHDIKKLYSTIEEN